MKKTNKLPPIHPGEILKEEFMVPLAMSANQLGMRLRVPTGRMTQIINGQRAITPDTALRLSRLFGTTAQFWLNLQQKCELQIAEDESLKQIEAEVVPLKTAN